MALSPVDALATAPAIFEALPRVYLFEKMQDIIWTVIETEDPQKRFFKARLSDVY